MVANDDGNGQFVKASGSATIVSSSINYTTGAWAITLNAAAVGTEAMEATYQYGSEASGNLPQIMRHINGAYTTYFNVKRARAGHLFQGRYKAIVVQMDAYAKELSRYIHLYGRK